jgi:3-deoxy-D-manno-octulosonic-acid transferase
MWLLYDLTILLYGLAIRIASLFNHKARLWVAGRRAQLDSWTVGKLDNVSQRSTVSGQMTFSNQKSEIRNQKSFVAWFHCSSLGEFEQGRPVIEAFRDQHPDWKILLTFFSPSGYEVRKDYKAADGILYLPLDTPGNARKFIQAIKPTIAVFIKYEFWFRYIDRLYEEKIPTYIISGIFRSGQHFFQWYGKWTRNQLKKISHFFVQDENSKILLNDIGLNNITMSGDTRFDRVAAIAEKTESYPLVETFSRDSKVLMAGSTWPADERLFLELMNQTGDDVKFIIAPHEVAAPRIQALQRQARSHQAAVSRNDSAGYRYTDNSKLITLFSQLTPENAASAGVLIIDGIGYLSHLYQYATIAFIGGGFGAGIHNILEAATFGKPIVFGPNYRKFREAVKLVELGGAFPVKNSNELHSALIELLRDEKKYAEASEICRDYVRKNQGATEIILKGLCVK